MTKVSPYILDQELSDQDDWEWQELIQDMHQSDWWETNSDHQHWSWYMERHNRLEEGWTLIIINPDHKNITVAHWLKQQGVEFEYCNNEFLIQDSRYATLVAIKWS